MQNSRILVVDDEHDLCRILKYNLEKSGFDVDIALSAEDALTKPIAQFRLILLDIMMHGLSGFDFIRILRNELRLVTPVIFLTALNSEDKLLQGFKYGADDFIKKPFSVKEVIARVQAVIERTEHIMITNESMADGVRVNNRLKQIFIEDQSIEFTPTEYDIFLLLYNQPEKVFSRQDILNRIWNDQQDISGRTVDVNITRIRKKMGDWGKCIVTRSGYGYYFDHKNFIHASL